MKLIVQIPCLNEEDTIRGVVADIPRDIPGIDRVEILLIDDGSSDRTVEAALSSGVDHVISHTKNKGLARAFRTGLNASLLLGADIIVNTDGDNQYAGADIPALVAPILAGRADIVVGDRQTSTLSHFSPLKRLLQRMGSSVIRKLSKTEVADAVSGFRALSRQAALEINILTSFSYTIEMLIQAGSKGLKVVSVPIGASSVPRSSRLFKSIPDFIARSSSAMVRTYAMYKPLSTFFYIGIVLTAVGAIPILRFLYFWAVGEGSGHIQSLILGGVFIVLGFLSFMIGLLADLISFNRQLLEITLEKVRALETREWSHEEGATPKSRRSPGSAPNRGDGSEERIAPQPPRMRKPI